MVAAGKEVIWKVSRHDHHITVGNVLVVTELSHRNGRAGASLKIVVNPLLRTKANKKTFIIFATYFVLNMKVAVIMGSTSDLEIMSQAINVLEGFGVEVVKKVISAHRTPDLMCEFAKSAKSNGIGAIIAGAGGAAHVAGVVAGMTTVPVIGVPIQTKALGGMDSLLSIVQMPAGIPVATMAINGAKNAGLFAAQILALTDEALSAKLDQFRKEQTQKVLDATI